jgi:serine/threonine-protein kinase RsbW
MTKSTSFVHERLVAFGDTTELERIRQFVEAKAQEFGFSESIVHKIALAVDEACSNLIRHSYHLDPTKEFTVSIDAEGESLIIEIFDSGTAFNPMTVAAPDLKQYAAQHRKGGFGVHIIRMVMDGVEYLPATVSQPFNCLKLVKKLA